MALDALIIQQKFQFSDRESYCRIEKISFEVYNGNTCLIEIEERFTWNTKHQYYKNR
jgi:hypothetical protein